MSTLTADQQLTLPDPTTADNIPQIFTDLVVPGIESRLVKRYLSATDRATRNPSPGEGEISYLLDLKQFFYFTVGTWTILIRPGLLLAEDLKTGFDQNITAGTQTIIQTITLNVISGVKYLLTYDSRGKSTVVGNAHLVQFKQAAGATVTTASATIGNSRTWNGQVANVWMPISYSKIWTASSTGQFTVGVNINFFSGSGSSDIAGNANDEGIFRVFYAS